MALPEQWTPRKNLDRAALIGAVLLPGGLLLGAGWLIYRWYTVARRRHATASAS